MQPQVFDDEVQVKMKIESSSVDRSTGDLTPSFNQRTMSSVARMKDGQTTMIAAISRTEDSKQIKGLAFIGLIPILGRLFSTPTTSHQQNHVVITVTPHILRRADIVEEDRLTKDAGRGMDSTQQLTFRNRQSPTKDGRQNRELALDGGQEKPAMAKPIEVKPAVQELSTKAAIGIDRAGIVKTLPIPMTPRPAATDVAKRGEQKEQF
jgi:type II secretory pathway component GspD/PulD (secretin)